MKSTRLRPEVTKSKRIWIISLWAVFCIFIPFVSLSFWLFWREGLTYLRWALEVGSLVLVGYCIYLIYQWVKEEVPPRPFNLINSVCTTGIFYLALMAIMFWTGSPTPTAVKVLVLVLSFSLSTYWEQKSLPLLIKMWA